VNKEEYQERAETIIRKHQQRMREIEDLSRENIAVLGAENVRNILLLSDARVENDLKLGAERIDDLIGELRNRSALRLVPKETVGR